MNKILFFNADISTQIRNKHSLKKMVENIFTQEQYKLERLNYVFCSDSYLLALNQAYLKHDTLTDVITFCFSKKNEPINGEIYISIERVKENSRIFQSTFDKELLRVIIHGALHLCGYNDKKAKDKKVMKTKEDTYLNI